MHEYFKHNKYSKEVILTRFDKKEIKDKIFYLNISQD